MATNSQTSPIGPQNVGRYELLSPVASGALGELWRARIASGPEEGRIVGVRRIRRTAGIDSAAIERITNAGFAAMELRHPKIAAVLDVAVVDSEIAIVSEFIDGALLQSLMRPLSGKRASVSVQVALRLSLDILDALDAVRAPWSELFPDPETDDERRLATGVHGGLVPDDLLIATFGETMLLEAGLAGVALTIPSILEQPDVVAFRAPEQIEAKGPVDERADIFTVGAILWELIVGRSLFGPALLPRPVALPKPKGNADALAVSTVKRKVLTAPIQRLDTIPLLKGKVSKPLADLVARCLARDPAARFPSLAAASEAIKGLGPIVGSQDSVAKFVASLGLATPTLLAEEPPVEEPSRRSNRPTIPPVEDTARRDDDADTQRQKGEPFDEGATRPGTAPAAAGAARPRVAATEAATPNHPKTALVAATPQAPPASELVGSNNSESLAPADDLGVFAESLPPTDDLGVFAESLPPDAGGFEQVPATIVAAASIIPSTEVSRAPHSSPDPGAVTTVAPAVTAAALLASRELEADAQESSVTMLSSFPEPIDSAVFPRLDDGRAAPFPFAPSAAPGAFPVSRGISEGREATEPRRPAEPILRGDTTSAPVVRAIPSRDPSADSLTDSDVAALAPRARNRKLVVGITAAAGVLVVAGLLRMFLSGKDDHAETPANPSPPVVASPPAESPRASEAPSPEAPATTAPEPAKTAQPTAPKEQPSEPPAPTLSSSWASKFAAPAATGAVPSGAKKTAP